MWDGVEGGPKCCVKCNGKVGCTTGFRFLLCNVMDTLSGNVWPCS